SKPVELEWQFPIGLEATFANNLLVQQDRDVWYFSFCFAAPPLLFGSKEEVKAQVEKIESIPAKCVAQIVVPKECIPDFLQVINEQAEKARIAAIKDVATTEDE
ncbi:MAG: hypothetical protein ACREHD_33075, partial [Pirellulales bacterium]